MNVIVLAAGNSLQNSEEDFPVWLSEIEGRLVIERQIKQLSFSKDVHFIFVFRKKDIERFHLRDIIRQIAPLASLISVERQTQGAAGTALLCIDHVATNDELVVVSATDYIEVEFSKVIDNFRNRGADAGIITFESLHPRFSYVTLNSDSWVNAAAEKKPISRYANAGFYWFRQAKDLFESLQRMILKDGQVNGRFFIAPALNEMVLDHKKIGCYEVQPKQYHPLKIHSEVATFQLEQRK
jgi:NDP-sugar pyrophosphorylase family protein